MIMISVSIYNPIKTCLLKVNRFKLLSFVFFSELISQERDIDKCGCIANNWYSLRKSGAQSNWLLIRKQMAIFCVSVDNTTIARISYLWCAQIIACMFTI